MELRHLRYFVAVAEELHFTHAAEKLHIVQPALSKQIAALEEELGVKLFHRTKRRVELTEPGVIFLEESRQVLKKMEQAMGRVKSAASGQLGRLEIGFIGPATYSLLPRVLKTYRQRFPEVELELHEWTTTMQALKLHEKALQVGLIRLPLHDDRLVLETILREPVIVALPIDYPLAYREKIPLKMLADEPFIMLPRHREPGLYDRYISLCRQANFSPKVVQESHRIQTMISLVASGMGVAFVPASTQKLQRPEVVYRHLEDCSPMLEVAVARRREEPSPALRRFLDTIDEIYLPSGASSSYELTPP